MDPSESFSGRTGSPPMRVGRLMFDVSKPSLNKDEDHGSERSSLLNTSGLFSADAHEFTFGDDMPLCWRISLLGLVSL